MLAWHGWRKQRGSACLDIMPAWRIVSGMPGGSRENAACGVQAARVLSNNKAAAYA